MQWIDILFIPVGKKPFLGIALGIMNIHFLLEIWNCFAIESINGALLEYIHGISCHIVKKLSIVFTNANFTHQH